MTDRKSLDTTWNDLKAAWSRGPDRLPHQPSMRPPRRPTEADRRLPALATSKPKPAEALAPDCLAG